jgi:small subunit ribosomal protein S18
MADDRPPKDFRRERGRCRYCSDGIRDVDYKDLDALRRMTTQQGKLYGRKRSGHCAKHQRRAMRAVKQARYLGVLPYIGGF